ncbi:MAG: NYN domain-containing protein [Planctomycetota bacterium]
MPRTKPANCRTHVFFDGQSLFNSAKRCFGYSYPNYDPLKLAAAATALEAGRTLTKTHFYTGVHRAHENAFWYGFWTNKLNALKRAGGADVVVTERPLKYSDQPVEVSPGVFQNVRVGREKGIDIRIALDLVRLARRQEYDVAIVFSQDQDLLEAVDEVKDISTELGHWIRIECVYPDCAGNSNPRGINGTLWRKLDKAAYDACIDPKDYRPGP